MTLRASGWVPIDCFTTEEPEHWLKVGAGLARAVLVHRDQAGADEPDPPAMAVQNIEASRRDEGGQGGRGPVLAPSGAAGSTGPRQRAGHDRPPRDRRHSDDGLRTRAKRNLTIFVTIPHFMSDLATSPEAVLSVIMPCFNEEATVKTILDRVLESPLVGEVIAIDDASTDSTLEILRGYDDERLRVLAQPVNQGKGAALRRGFREATTTVRHHPGRRPRVRPGASTRR